MTVPTATSRINPPIPSAPPPSPNQNALKAQHHLASGAVSGFTSAICLQPLDLLKTRLQQSYTGRDTKRRKIRQVAKDVLREDGVVGLWRGAVPTVVRNVPGVALYFYALSSIRGRLSHVQYFSTIPLSISTPSLSRPSSSFPSHTPAQGVSTSSLLLSSSLSSSSSSSLLPPPSSTRSSSTALVKLSSQGNLIAGAIARTSVGFLLNPITVLKARYESNQFAEYRSLIGAFRSLLRTNGIRGLFQGFTATAVRDAPYAGLSLTFYEKAKDVTARLVKPEWGVPNAVLHSGSAAMSATLATLFTSPADCIKTRMQVNPADHPTLRKAISRIYLDRGIPGFFSGSILRISRKAASGAIAWTVYEGVLLFLRDR